jgi:hypothetical protein
VFERVGVGDGDEDGDGAIIIFIVSVVSLGFLCCAVLCCAVLFNDNYCEERVSLPGSLACQKS